ncbi:Snurportin-1, partial [Mucuna pruriens]
MAPHDLRRPFKRPAISDQERRREHSLLRQAQNRQDAQRHARFLASAALSLPSQTSEPESEPELELAENPEPSHVNLDVLGASKLKAAEARKWFAKQLMLPEWMIDIPNNLSQDWFVFARPSGKRCFVVSCNGTTISRLRNGSILHRFPSALPSGARKKDPSYSILDCIFHELAETGACDPPSYYHKYRFSLVPVYGCDSNGLCAAYSAPVPYVKDGLLFYNKHAHYQAGITPLALVWKDENCSQYVIDTDSKGQVPNQQQVVLELQEDGKLTTSDDPPVVFGCLDGSFIQQSELQSGCLLRFSIGEGGLVLMDGKLEKADLHYLGKANRARASADSFSKVMFQYSVRHSPLRIDGLLESVSLAVDQESKACDIEMD